MKSATEKLGDRHLRGFRAEARKQFLPGRVRIVTTRHVATTRRGQITLWFLANLLARQFEVVRRIELSVPDVPMRPGVAFFGAQATLAATLESTVRGIAKDAIEFDTSHGPESCDLEIHVAPVWSSGAEQRAIGIWGDGWRCAAGANIECDDSDETGNPIGPILAACFGAAEAFRYITNWRSKGREICRTVYFSAWDGSQTDSWTALAPGMWHPELALPPFYLVGSGAVGQAFAATLGLCGSLGGHAVVLDRDPVDDTNFNRYCLAWTGCGTNDKTKLGAEALRVAGITADPIAAHLNEYLQRPTPRTTSPVMNANEVAYRFPLVISCVDKNHARHSIQNLWPRHILGGSTDGLSAKVMRYDVAGQGECLKCANPVTEEPTVEAQAEELRKLSPEQLDSTLAALSSVEQEAVRRYLNNPKCGELAETVITELGREQRREFAVGFVSVASGAILAAAFLQHALGQGDLMNSSANLVTLSFQSCRSRKDFYRKDPTCECAGAKLFRLIWDQHSDASTA